jgi:hypothetical protein
MSTLIQRRTQQHPWKIAETLLENCRDIVPNFTNDPLWEDPLCLGVSLSLSPSLSLLLLLFPRCFVSFHLINPDTKFLFRCCKIEFVQLW